MTSTETRVVQVVYRATAVKASNLYHQKVTSRR
jgi:hypothetical protein